MWQMKNWQSAEKLCSNSVAKSESYSVYNTTRHIMDSQTTARQQLVYQYVEFRIDHGLSPTIREIAMACYPGQVPINVGNAVRQCLLMLERKGKLYRARHPDGRTMDRGLRLNDGR